MVVLAVVVPGADGQALVVRGERLCDPQAQREFLSRIDSYRGKGPPSAEQRMSREEIRTQFGV